MCNFPLPTRILIAVATTLQAQIDVHSSGDCRCGIVALWIVDRHRRRTQAGSIELKLKLPDSRESVDDVFDGAAFANAGDAASGWNAAAVGAGGGAGRVGQHRSSRRRSRMRSVRFAKGSRCPTAWRRRGHFPDLALEMMRVGEQTGSLAGNAEPRGRLLR